MAQLLLLLVKMNIVVMVWVGLVQIMGSKGYVVNLHIKMQVMARTVLKLHSVGLVLQVEAVQLTITEMKPIADAVVFQQGMVAKLLMVNQLKEIRALALAVEAAVGLLVLRVGVRVERGNKDV